jgi:hypothetical protein
MIPKVKDFGAKFQLLRFGQIKYLRKTEVPVLLGWSAIQVATEITIAGASIGPDYRSGRECPDV